MLRRLIYIRIATCAIVWGGAAASAQVQLVQQVQQVQCAASVLPGVVRAEGLAELIGDIVLTCTGGVPTAAGRNLPTVSLQVTFNTRVTSRLLANQLSEAMLLIDDPQPGGQFPCATAACGAVAGQPLGSGPRENRNIYQAVPLIANSLLWRSFPLDPPGTATRILRLKNIRIDAASLGSGSAAAPGQVVASVSLSGKGVTGGNSVLAVGFPQAGVSASVLDATGAAKTPLLLPTAATVNNPVDANSNVNFLVQFQEGFASSFRKRNAATSAANPAAMSDQADPSTLYSSESGFYNSSFAPASGQNLAGLADQGTRLKAAFTGIPPGVSLYVTTNAISVSGSSTIAAGLVAVDVNGAGAANLVSPTTTLAGGAGIAPLSIVNGTALAVWEIFDADPAVLETIRFGVVVSYAPGASGTASVSGSLAPSGSPSSPPGPVPQFTFGGSAQPAFTISTDASMPAIMTPSPLPAGQKGAPYSQLLAARGGAPPYRWAIRSGALPVGLVFDAAKGSISGVPPSPGTGIVNIAVIDSAGLSASKNLSIFIADTPVQVTTQPPLATGMVGIPYSQVLTATGGTPPYNWAISSGALPAGLTLDRAAGQITGTPTTPGIAVFTATVADQNGQSVSKPFSITINSPPAPSITTPSLPDGVVSTAYTATLTASGGSGSYTWSIAGGSLPSGLSLNAASGAIAGTPTAAGLYAFTVRVADSFSSATKDLSITVKPPSINITTASPLPQGMIATAYTQTFAAAGGVPPYAWSIANGAAPPGLAFSSSGVLSGTPSKAGTFALDVRVADTTGAAAVKSYNVIVSPLQLSIVNSSLPDGSTGIAYSQTLSALGGTPPYVWSISSGALATGLALNAATGVISGTATAAGVASFTARVTDAASATAERAFAVTFTSGLRIGACPSASATVGQPYVSALIGSGGVPPYAWSVTGGPLPPGMSLSTDGGALAGTPAQAGSFTFTIVIADRSTSTFKDCSVFVRDALLLAPSSLPDGTENARYLQNLTASGGTPPYAWSLASGSLPTGLALTPSGQISGAPTRAGLYSFTMRASDSAGVTTDLPLTIRILTVLAAGACPADPASAGQSYSFTFTAAGGVPPYTWSVASGALPPGISLGAADGVLRGTPPNAGTFRFDVAVRDNTSASVTRSCSLLVASASGPSITTASLSAGTVRRAYTQPVLAAGGKTPYRWSLAKGQLAAGLTLDPSTGRIAGTPASAGSFSFTVQVTDGANQTASHDYTLTVVDALTITTSALPKARLGLPYQRPLEAAGGSLPYAWTVSAGALPNGLALDAAGAINGAPLSPGSYDFTVQVTDGARGIITRPLHLDVELQVPAASPTNLPPVVDPAQQLSLGLALDVPYSSDLRGKVTLDFASDSENPQDDRMVQFSTGGRALDFTFPQGATAAVLPVPNVAVLSGTVSGTITLRFSVFVGDAPIVPSPWPDVRILVERRPPVITSISLEKNPAGFDVTVIGYSTTREIKQAAFSFEPAASGNLGTPVLRPEVGPAFRKWYTDPASGSFGSQFRFTQSFTVNGDPAAIGSVGVTLENQQGPSAPAKVKL